MAPWSGDNPDLPKHRKPCDLPTPQSSASFWHKEPSSLLSGHRSTRELPTSADVVVIGSGMTGASIAHHLLAPGGDRAKPDVVLLEAREACWGATGRNGGHCQPILFEHPNDPSIGHFELRNFYALQNLIRKKNIDCEFVVQPGVRALYSKTHLETLQSALLRVKSNAPELASMMRLVTNKEELTALRIPTAIAAVVTTLAARMWPYKLVSRILEDLVTATDLNGTFNLQTLTPATSLAHERNGIRVHTPRGTILTDKVILATNAYTSHLLPNFADLIVPCRGQMSALTPFPSIAASNRLTTSFGFLGDGLDDYLIQRPNESGGQLMFGGGRQHGPSLGVTDDSVVDPQTSHYLQTRLGEVFALPESGKEMAASHIWTGIMGFSRDEKPWVGAVPGREGVYVAAGFTGHGMPNTWLSGAAVAEMVLGSLEGKGERETMERVGRVGLPKAYVLSKERMEAAMELEDVEAKDWAEMQRGRQTL